MLRSKWPVIVSLVLPFLTGPVLAQDKPVIIKGARILTMDDAKPEATAIAVVDGKIAAVGSDADVEPYLTGATVYDLPGALVLPGFHDSHNHLVWSATELQDLDLTDVADADALRAAAEPKVAALPEGAWLRGSMWDIAAWPDVTAAMLDDVTGARPAYISSADAHSAWVNTAALKAAGISADTKDPEGGRIERDASGNPTGVLRENAMTLVSGLLADYPDAQVDAGLTAALEEAQGYGIVAVIDPSAKEWMLRAYKRFDDAGKLKMRVKAAVEIEPKEGKEGLARVLDYKARYAGPHLEVNAAKLFVDGVIETGTAALVEAYVGSNANGELLFTPEAMKEIAVAVDGAGLQLHAHAIGDRAIRATLDAYEAAAAANGKRDSRHQITHVQLIDPADVPRFAALGALANIQALWAYPDSYIADLTEPKLGPQRSEWLYPFAALRDAGATLVGSSDWSVSSMNPLEAIQTGVTRQDIADDAGRVLTPQHKLDVMDMLRAYTINGAFAAFDEANSGSLAVGKRADIVILDRDITTVAPTDIADGKVLATIIAGETVFAGEGLPAPASP